MNVDKEVEWLSAEILPKILKSNLLVENYAESQLNTFAVGEITIKVIGIEEAFMLTQCYRATVNFAYAGEQYQRKLVVKKTPPIPKEAFDEANFKDLFDNEICFYTEILPIIKNLSNNNFSAPKYYYSELNPESAVLILGDFGADGWSVAKDRYGLSLEHAQIAVKYLGRFHGFGYALKATQKERFDQLATKCKESRYATEIGSPVFMLMMNMAYKRLGLVTKKYQPEVDNDFTQKLLKLVSSYLGYGRQRVAPREPYATLCHGDYLRNNVAYKYDTDTSGKPLDIMMFDYQTLRLCSPMIDLAVFLNLSVLAEVRVKHFDSLFDDYCNALFESYTEQAHLPLPDFLNRKGLLREYIKFLPYSVSISSTFLMALVEPIPMTPEEMFTTAMPDEQVLEMSMKQGGELVDREIAHQMKELFDLSRLHQVEIDEDIENQDWVDSVKLE